MDFPVDKRIQHNDADLLACCLEEIHCVKNLDKDWECRINEPGESCALCFARYLNKEQDDGKK